MKNYITTVSAIAILVCIVSCSKKNDSEIVFIDTIKVFEGFDMKKDYDKKLENDLVKESQLMDSVNQLLNKATQANDELGILKLKKDYFLAEKILNEKFQKLSQKYTSEVNERLNEYIKEFGKKNEYDFILGSSGQGNIMYVKEGHEVTSEVISFVNENYSK